jgi:hypothetical protein
MPANSLSRVKLAERFLARAEELVSIQLEIIVRLKRIQKSTEAAEKLLVKLQLGVKHAMEGRDLATALATASH